MGELHHEKAERRSKLNTDRGNTVPLPYACEVHIHLRIPDDCQVGGWHATRAIQVVGECDGWILSDRSERRGPEAVLLHLVYVAAGRPKAVRQGLKRLNRHLEALEDWDEAKIGVDSYVVPILY